MKFFRSVLTSDKNSFLRIVFLITLSPVHLLTTPPGDTFEIEPSRSATAHPVIMQSVQKLPRSKHSSKRPPPLQPAILQATLEDTYIDDGGVGANSIKELSALQDEIGKILGKGGFHVKSWECSGEDGTSKYLGMTWDRLKDHYLLKFRSTYTRNPVVFPPELTWTLNFSRIILSIPITKKNVLSVACQFYNPTGLAAPLMFFIRALFSELCRDSQCSISSVLSKERTDRFRRAVGEILLTKEISFPRQIIFNYSAQLYIFFDGSLQGYGACVYACSNDQFNILYSSAKILGKTAFSASQSKIAGAILAARIEQKISQELFNVSLFPPVFIGDSEIILKMIAKNDLAGPPVFYGTRLMEILSILSPENWFWCPGSLNPANLLTRSGTNCN